MYSRRPEPRKEARERRKKGTVASFGLMPSPPPATACARCGAPRTAGRFCAECGAPFEGAICAACGSTLSQGAHFCHRCGTAAGATPPADHRSATLPWAITSIAVLALVALVVGRNFRLGASGPGEAVTTPTAPPSGPPADDPSAGQGGSDGGADVVRAPDISTLSPRERADRLYDRVMRLAEQGKTDSVEFFAPMVMSAYQMMGPLDADGHYDLGRIGIVTGVTSLAAAEADTILRQNPTHLLGLALAARAAANQPRSVARGYNRRLLAAAPAELKKNLPEYARHRNDIEAALADAKNKK